MKQKLYADTDVFSFGVIVWEVLFHCRPWHHGEFAPDGATIVDIGVAYRAHQYLSVDGAINGRVLNDAQKQGLGGCFDVSGNRADFSVLLLLLREELEAARDHATMSEEEQQELLFGPADAVSKHDSALLATQEETHPNSCPAMSQSGCCTLISFRASGSVLARVHWWAPDHLPQERVAKHMPPTHLRTQAHTQAKRYTRTHASIQTQHTQKHTRKYPHIHTYTQHSTHTHAHAHTSNLPRPPTPSQTIKLVRYSRM